MAGGIEHRKLTTLIESIEIADSDLDYLKDVVSKNIQIEYNPDDTISKMTIQSTKADGTSYTKTIEFTYDANGNITGINISVG